MKSIKMIQKFAYGVIGLAIVVLIALTVYQHYLLTEISETPAVSTDNPLTEDRGDTAAVETTP